MKVLLLAPHPFYTPRGTPIAVREVISGLTGMGHTVDVLSFHEGEDVSMPGLKHLRIGKPPGVKKVPIGPSWQKAVCDVFLMLRAAKLLRTGQYDVVHAVEESAMIAGILQRVFGVPFIFDMDSLMSRQIAEKSPWLKPATAVFKVLETRALRRSYGVLAVCQDLVDHAKVLHPTGNVHLLPDVPNTGRADGPLPDSLTQAPGVRLVYVGNLEHYQGIDLMLEAFAAARSRPQAKTQATLVVVGGREDHIEHYRTRANELGVGEQTRWVGPVPIQQLGRVMEYADVLVSPRTRGNNTPMKVYSYLASGKPVLATRLLTHTQVLHDEVSKLCDAEPEVMGQAMVELIEDATLRETLGQAGQAYVEREFSRDAFLRRLSLFYDGMQSGEANRASREPGGAAPTSA